MATQQEAAFNKVGKRFLDYYDQVRGYVREQLARRNLQPYLGNAAMNIVDVGGGDARDAVWLASQGHNVTIVDPSEKMLAKAAAKIDEQDTEVQSRISEPIQGTVFTVPYLEGQFDMVLSHGVLMYDLKNSSEHVKRLVKLGHHEGIISILTKGYGGTVTRAIDNERDPKKLARELAELKKTHQTINNLGEQVWAFEPSHLVGFLRGAGASVLGWSGVRIAAENDRRPITEVSEEELEMILGIEEQLGHSQMRDMGQMLHFIAQRKWP